jgi:hypothetical protein
MLLQSMGDTPVLNKEQELRLGRMVQVCDRLPPTMIGSA